MKLHYKPVIVSAYFKDMGLPEPVYEFRHIPGRKFRLDIAWPHLKVGLECQGGLHMRSGHTTASGLRRDMEKRNLGHVNGWRIVECEPANLCMAETVELIKAVMDQVDHRFRTKEEIEAKRKFESGEGNEDADRMRERMQP